ncbi:NAD(P)-dependent oxidoreductase [Gilliamella sp. BG7]|uniref:NAD(P)-dependent oxidoreductase n=1 Tax=Gilliamella sp. BG7 TaxID=3351513 RepID=UPI0039888EEE
MFLDNVLKQADFVVIILPLIHKKTTQLFTKEKLALIKPSRILIYNTRKKLLINKRCLEHYKIKRAKPQDLMHLELNCYPPIPFLLQTL